MRIVVEILLWVWIALEYGVNSDSLSEITNRMFIEQCVKAHNEARSSVDPPASDMLYMTWDEGLAITARAWARQCVFKHNIYLKDVRRVHPNFRSVGENIWAGYPPSSFDAVWASSFKVGCAAQLCPNGVKDTNFATKEGVIFVCNYATAGNVNGGRPYATQGAACSKCEGTCENNLCRSQERDLEKSYNWSPDLDLSEAAPENRGSNYVTVLVARPIALICTFIAAYVVHYFYPDMFCYE
ncbi:GLIPR1-like protein 1 isoform X2 [Scomber scombrus]|uniref:GLIPR1-like protein 1 isoform X2 n=1 Tax=Scomber scombrus TaxID=13677 RepID=UPI002DDC819D|nr:GLIPR1-like protein 1 isoform X2 [Scomber scombrus]